ncbi:MAG TPA: phytanoyl-CoA dioxygenase family protein [Bryocella sp.]|nr:phytanoyl-CoA dioxygenase family protein [Bryocella sp.]
MAAVASVPELWSCGILLDDERLGLMRESQGTASIATLQQQMQNDGYLLLRGLLDPGKVLAARRRVMQQLSDARQLDPEKPMMDGIPRPGTKLYFQPELAQKNNPELQELLYADDGELMSFFREFLGGPIRHFDFTWLRCISPGPGTPSHCDIVYMGRGTRRLYTTWVPLGKADFETGGLMVLEGSHTNVRLQQTYGQRDVDSYCENRPEDKARTSHGYNGFLSPDSNKVRRQLGERWLVAEYEPGDAVVFCMDLVHGGLDNRSNRLRLSSDSRYQLAGDPVDERWVGENPPGHGSAGKRGRVC